MENNNNEITNIKTTFGERVCNAGVRSSASAMVAFGAATLGCGAVGIASGEPFLTESELGTIFMIAHSGTLLSGALSIGFLAASYFFEEKPDYATTSTKSKDRDLSVSADRSNPEELACPRPKNSRPRPPPPPVNRYSCRRALVHGSVTGTMAQSDGIQPDAGRGESEGTCEANIS